MRRSFLEQWKRRKGEKTEHRERRCCNWEVTPATSPGNCLSLSYGFVFFLRFYLFIHERHRERGRDTGRGRSRLHAGSLMWDSVPGLGSHPEPKAEAEPLSHPGIPGHCYSNDCLSTSLSAIRREKSHSNSKYQTVQDTKLLMITGDWSNEGLLYKG